DRQQFAVGREGARLATDAGALLPGADGPQADAATGRRQPAAVGAEADPPAVAVHWQVLHVLAGAGVPDLSEDALRAVTAGGHPAVLGADGAAAHVVLGGELQRLAGAVATQDNGALVELGEGKHISVRAHTDEVVGTIHAGQDLRRADVSPGRRRRVRVKRPADHAGPTYRQQRAGHVKPQGPGIIEGDH